MTFNPDSRARQRQAEEASRAAQRTRRTCTGIEVPLTRADVERTVQEEVSAHRERLRRAWANRNVAGGEHLWRESLELVHRDVLGALCRLTGDVQWLTMNR